MAIKRKKEEVKEEVKFKEFKFDGKTFHYTGRVYPKQEGKGKVKASYYCTITMNELYTVKGCYLIETENDVFIKWPQYKTENGYSPFIYTDKAMNDELNDLAYTIALAAGVEAE